MIMPEEDKNKKKAHRPTFQDCKHSEAKLLKWIDNLIEENRPVEEDKREIWLRLTANSTLGEGNKIEIGSRHLGYLSKYDWNADGSGSTIDAKNYGDVIRYSCYEDSKEVAGKPISKMWKKIRAILLRIFPFALQVAIRSSQEIVDRGETDIHDI